MLQVYNCTNPAGQQGEMMYASCLGENKHREPGCFASACVCLSTGGRLPAALGRLEMLGDPWPNSASLGGHKGLGVSQGCWLGCDAAWGCSVPSSCWDRLWHGPVFEFLARKAPSAAVERVPGGAPTAWVYVAALLLLLLLRPSSWPPWCTFSMCYINIDLRSHKLAAEPWG